MSRVVCVTDVQDAVETLAAQLGCAVLIEDGRHRPLWWSAQGEVDGVRTRTILQREAPPAAAALVVRLGLAAAQGPVRTPALPEVDMAARWCVPMRDRRQLLGYLWVLDADGHVGEPELPALIACAELAAGTLARARPGTQEHLARRAALLSRLLSGPDDGAARELADLESLPVDVTVAVNAPLARDGWALPNGSSVHVDPAPDATFTSGAPVALVDLGVAANRATVTQQALRAGARLPAPSWDALGAWHLIVAAPPDLTPGQVHPAADVLLARARPEMLVTARCVLDNGADVTTSANELHIHRTTLHYRLDRILALTGVDLRKAADRDDLHFALLLAAYRQAA